MVERPYGSCLGEELVEKVTFGIVNCNRLHYLKSCFESIILTTEEYENKEFIVVDNASVEEGTDHYLKELESRGVKVFRSDERDPSNEFAKGLNRICKEASGDFVIPLQGDVQFYLKGWLTEYVDFYRENKNNIGSICLDAQRRVTHNSHSSSMTQFFGPGKIKFCYDLSRPSFSGAGDCMYSREMIELFYPWSESNQNHEGSLDSETSMLEKVKTLTKSQNLEIYCAVPSIPSAIAIFTDSRGTNARVRGSRRYGDYWPAKNEDSKYYELSKIEDLSSPSRRIPLSIEDVANPIGWKVPIDANGSWMKNPIRPELATLNDFVDL